MNRVKKIFSLYQKHLIIVFLMILVLAISLAVNSGKKNPILAYSLDRFKDTNIIIKPNESKYSLPINQTNSGEYYRLTFEMKCRPENDDQITRIDDVAKQLIKNEDSKIVLYLKNKFGEEVLLKEVDIVNSDQYRNFEIIIAAKENFESISFKKASMSDTNSIFLNDLAFTKLNIKSEKELTQLKPVVKGNIGQDSVNPSIAEQEDVLFRTNAKEGIIGQFFHAKEPYLAGVSFKFNIRGNGGKRAYVVRLYEAKKEGDTFSIIRELPNKYEFPSFDPVSFLDQYKDDHFPIASFLTPGNYYFIGLDTSMAETDRKNYLEILGGKDGAKYSEGAAAFYDGAGNVEKIEGDLFLKVYNNPFSTVESQKILTGSRIEPFGGGSGSYSYRLKNLPSDYLDLDEASLTGHDDKVFFDAKTKAVLGIVEENNFFTYKINTIYPLTKFSINYQQLGDNYYDSLIYFSTDNINWQPIVPLPDDEEDFSTTDKKKTSVISTNKPFSQLFIKISPDLSDNGKTEGLFGLKSFSIVGDLKIN